MSYVSSLFPHGQAPSSVDADNTVSIDQQEAALIWELRRLQRFLDEERDQQRFTHAIDLQSEDRPPKRPRGAATSTCEAARQQGRAASRQAGLQSPQTGNTAAAAQRSARKATDAPGRKSTGPSGKRARTSAAHSSAPRAGTDYRAGSHCRLRRRSNVKIRCGQLSWRDRVLSGRISHGSACAQAMHSWSAGRRPSHWTGLKQRSQKG